MEKIDDAPRRMDTLHQMAHPKSPKTPATVCGMSGRNQLPADLYTIESSPGHSFANQPTNTITCMAGGEEMLRVSPDGFWVRGKKVAQDDNEAEAVYNAFKAWMTWATLNKDYK